MRTTTTGALALAGFALAACGGAGGGGGDGEDFVLPPEYQPFLTEDQIAARLDERSDLVNLEETPNLAVLPTGTADYSGTAVFNLDVDDDGTTDHRLVGDISLRAELLFAGDDITGSIGNFHSRDGFVPTENLEGGLTVTGELDDGNKEITGTIDGELDGYLGGDRLQVFTMAGTFDGVVRQRPNVRTNPIIPPGTDRAAALTADMDGQLGGDLSGGTFNGGFAVDR